MKFLTRLFLAALLMLPAGESFAGSYTSLNYTEDGVSTIKGTLNVKSGGLLTIDSGAIVTDSSLTLATRNGRAPVACGATCTLGAANANATTLLNLAAGSVATLPGATGSGTVYKMMVSVATTSAAEKVLTNPVTDTIIGTATGENSGTAKVFVGNASTYHSIQMPFTGSVPSGGFIGDTIVCTDVASTIWMCNIFYQAGTTPTTPYSASTT